MIKTISMFLLFSSISITRADLSYADNASVNDLIEASRAQKSPGILAAEGFLRGYQDTQNRNFEMMKRENMERQMYYEEVERQQRIINYAKHEERERCIDAIITFVRNQQQGDTFSWNKLIDFVRNGK